MSFDSIFSTRNDFGLFYFIRVGGLPYLFCAGEAPYWMRTGRRSSGRGYVTFDGLEHEWSETLSLESGLAMTGSALQPKGGMPSSGSIAFTLRVDSRGHDHGVIEPTSLWLSLLQRNAVMSRKTANLAVDIPADGTPDIVMLSNPWTAGLFSSGGAIYCGLETFRVGTTTQNSTTLGPILTRGAYGSVQREHEATVKTDTESFSSGLILSDAPLVWEGRTVELYATIGRWRLDRLGDGVPDVPEFEPYMDDEGTVFGSYTKLIRRFTLTNVREGGDHASVVLECAEIDALIDGDILARAPTAKAGRGPGWDYDARSGGLRSIYIGEHNWRFSMVVRSDGALAMPLQCRVLDGTVSDGDTVTFGTPAGNVVMTARTTPSTPDEFLIGALPYETAGNLSGALALYSAWTDYYTYPRRSSLTGGFIFVYRGGEEGGPYGLSTSNTSAFVFSQDDTSVKSLSFINQRLRRATHSGGNFEDVPEGVYPPSELASYMRDTVAEVMRDYGYNVFYSGADAWGATNPEFWIGREKEGDGETSNKLALIVSFPGSAVTQGWAVDIFTRYDGKESFLRDLGFTDDAYFIAGETGNGFRATATKSPPAFRWPAAGYARPNRLYLSGMSAWDIANFEVDTGHFYEVGSATGRWLIIDGVDLVQYGLGNIDTFVSNFNNPLSGDGWYVDVEQSNVRSWAKTEETYVEIVNPQEKEQQTVKVERVIYFPLPVTLGEALLQLLIGGSGVEGTHDPVYDVGWFGCGLAIPGSYIDVASFELYRDNGFEKRQFCIRAGDKIRSLLDNECKAAQVQVVAEWGGQIRLMDTRPPLTGAAAAMELDANNLVHDLANQGIGFDRAENRIVNQVDIKAAYNPVSKKFDLDPILNLRQDSISTYGKKEPMTLQLMGTPAFGAAYALRLADRIFSAYAKPYGVIEMYLATPRGWSLRRGDVVTITSPVLPDPDGYGRGVAALPCKVFGKEDYYTGGGNERAGYFTKLTLVCRAYSGDRFGTWAPAARMVSRSGAVCTCAEKLYSNPADAATHDVALFSAGMLVEVFSFASGTVEQRTILSVDAGANTITLSSAPTPTAGLIYFREYGAQITAQKAHASFGDGSKFISGTDKPYSYH